jgi:hypothetical protein
VNTSSNRNRCPISLAPAVGCVTLSYRRGAQHTHNKVRSSVLLMRSTMEFFAPDVMLREPRIPSVHAHSHLCYAFVSTNINCSHGVNTSSNRNRCPISLAPAVGCVTLYVCFYTRSLQLQPTRGACVYPSGAGNDSFNQADAK